MTSTSAIPTISFTAAPETLAKQILQAGTTCGFFYLTDLPFDWALVDEAWQASQQFFLASGQEADRQRLASRDREGHTGYTALHEEKLDPSDPAISQGDLKESFYIAALSPQPRQVLPPPLAQHHAALDTLFQSCRSTCAVLLRAAAQALQLDQDFFAAKHNGHDDRLRLIHYPPAAVGQGGASIRAGAHTDYGSVTLLFQRDVSGLQVWLDGHWVDVAPRPHAIVVNVADALEFWTAGLLRSIQHRVVMPRTNAESVSRFSIAYFCQPDAEAVLDPVAIQTEVPVGMQRSTQAYEAELRRKGIHSPTALLTGGEHLQSRLRASYLVPNSVNG